MSSRNVAVRAFVLGALVSSVGAAEITLINPGVGGGSSAPFYIPIVEPRPSVGSTFPRPLIAGEPTTTTLIVRGQRLNDQTTILWSGEERQTTARTGSEVSTVLNVADQASPGLIELRVRNEGGVSPAYLVPIVDPTIPPPDHKVLLRHHDIVYDENSGILYLSMRGDDLAHPDRLVAFDPESGMVAWFVDLPFTPEHLALSALPRKLYVSEEEGSLIARIDLSTRSLDQTITLPSTAVALDIAIPDGVQDVIVVAYRSSGGPRERVLAAYRGGVRLQRVFAGQVGPTQLAVADGTPSLWGLDQETVRGSVYEIRVDSDGVVLGRVIEGTGSKVDDFMTLSDGTLHFSNGERLDVASGSWGLELPVRGYPAVDQSGNVHYLIGNPRKPGIHSFSVDGSILGHTIVDDRVLNIYKMIPISGGRMAIGRGNWIIISRSPYFDAAIGH